MLPCEGREVRATLASLQARLLITVSGGSLAGWTMHEWDLLKRCLPPDQRRELTLEAGRRELIRAFVAAVLAGKPGAIARLFGWSVAETRAAIDELAADGALVSDVPIEGLPGRFVAAPQLAGGETR